MRDISTSSADIPSCHERSMQGRLVRPNNPFLEFKREEIEQSITARFEQQVERYPEHIAVKTKSHALTYHGLNQSANRLAHAILANRGEGEETIVLLLEHGIPAIVALLGVLKSGKTYVPLDPLYPLSRNTYILEDSQAHLIITNSANLTLAKQLSRNGCQLIVIDEMDSHLSAENTGLTISPDTMAYILYTSGSTGHPKGVIQNHRNLLHNVMKYTNGIHISADDHLSLIPSLSFAASVSDIYGALLNGAALFPFNLKEEGLTNLAKWLIKDEITVYHSVPTVFRYFAVVLTGKEEFTKLRLIKLGGEQVFKKDVELYRRYFCKDCILHIGLGATEMNIIRQYFIDKEITLDGSIVPVGYSVNDTDVILIDDGGKEVGFNRIGEIAIKSRYLAPGYWQKPELTQAKFLADPQGGDERIYLTGDLGRMLPDGCLLYLGRKDLQVKIRGHRIEIAEVEIALFDIDGIKEAVVVAREDQHGEQRLLAYIVAEWKTPPSIGKLRSFLLEKIPDFMVPSVFALLDSIPRTPNGKVDRGALPTLDLSRNVSEKFVIPPRTPLEIQIAEIWKEALRVDQVGLDDNFFDLGGHSLLLMEVIAKLENLLGIHIHPVILISKTLEEIASACEETISRSNTGNQMAFRNRLQNAVSTVVSRFRDREKL